MTHPRLLSLTEKEILYWLLPEIIHAYKPYYDFVQTSQIIGEGRWGEGDLIFGKKLSSIDRSLGMPSVVAYGECQINDRQFSISVHEFNIDDQLEVQFSRVYPIPESIEIKNTWCYSYWKPGDLCPATATKVKEIAIQNVSKQIKYTLAISAAKKVLWLHHAGSGFNQLIPLTPFYDELLRTKHIRDAKLISHPVTFFEKVNEFSDADYIQALLEYNKKASRKFDASDIVVETEKPKKSIFQKLFGT
jgi:hypothetical protein